jgi:transposase
MEARQQRGLIIAATAKLTLKNGVWIVPSQSNSIKYFVRLELEKPTCSCPDHAALGCKCKHIFAAEYTVQREDNGDGTVTETVTETRTEQKTYSQDWPAYNKAQINEKRMFQALLRDLCRSIPSPKTGGNGRPRIPLKDAVFSTAYKVYSTVSGRRFISDLVDAQAKGYLTKVPHFNSISNYLENPDLSSILTDLVVRCSLPLRAVESDFAIDSTGFSSSRFVKWFDHKYGSIQKEHNWVKCHIMCGVKTNIVTAVEIHGRNANDYPILPSLVKKTGQNFKMAEVSADKAYCGHTNLAAIIAAGAEPYLAFKSNITGDDGGLFAKMFHYFKFNQEEFMTHYHKRSNIESTMNMIKSKFRDHVRSRTEVAMKNEALCKVLCHNICCLISATYELGISPKFSFT